MPPKGKKSSKRKSPETKKKLPEAKVAKGTSKEQINQEKLDSDEDVLSSPEETLEQPTPKKKNLSFSKWNIENVRKKFGFHSEHVDDSIFQHVKLETKLILLVKEEITEVSAMLDIRLGSGNESDKREFISRILQKVIVYYEFNETIRMKTEKYLEGDDTQGDVEYVLMAKTSNDLPIVFLIEAKKDDFEQGRAQCYMELYTAAQMNTDESEDYNFPLYGVVTTAEIWRFVKYDPKLYDEKAKVQRRGVFTESNPVAIVDDVGLRNMLEIFVGILTTQRETLQKLDIEFTL